MATTGNKAETEGQDRTRTGSSTEPLLHGALNVPNAITLSRLLLAVVLFVLIDIKGFWITAAVLFVVAASTDFLDGYIARRYGLVTTLGRILDPFVDKIIVIGTFIFLLGKKIGIEGGVEVHSGVNAWMVIIIIGREMFITSLRGFLERQGQDFSASLTGKIKMTLQCIAITASLLSLRPEISRIHGFLLMRDILLWTAVAFTAYSGADYMVRASRMLRADDHVDPE